MAHKGSPLDIAHKKAMKKTSRSKKGGNRKHGRNRAKCQRYRERVGKPAGPGQEGRKH